jgi:microcystin-dependent protein
MESVIDLRDLEWWLVVRPTKAFVVGTIIPFHMAKKFPVGATHFADGSEVSTEEFPDLYEQIKSTFGGNEEKFNLPDLRMRLVTDG